MGAPNRARAHARALQPPDVAGSLGGKPRGGCFASSLAVRQFDLLWKALSEHARFPAIAPSGVCAWDSAAYFLAAGVLPLSRHSRKRVEARALRAAAHRFRAAATFGTKPFAPLFRSFPAPAAPRRCQTHTGHSHRMAGGAFIGARGARRPTHAPAERGCVVLGDCVAVCQQLMGLSQDCEIPRVARRRQRRGGEAGGVPGATSGPFRDVRSGHPLRRLRRGRPARGAPSGTPGGSLRARWPASRSAARTSTRHLCHQLAHHLPPPPPSSPIPCSVRRGSRGGGGGDPRRFCAFLLPS